MREVATAGVSIKTVSRVVNAARGDRPEVQDKVRSAIALLGYRRNEVARNLRPGQRSNTVGLVIEDIANPFYSAVTRGVEEVARKRGVMVLSASSAGLQPRCSSRRLDGDRRPPQTITGARPSCCRRGSG